MKKALNFLKIHEQVLTSYDLEDGEFTIIGMERMGKTLVVLFTVPPPARISRSWTKPGTPQNDAINMCIKEP